MTSGTIVRSTTKRRLIEMELIYVNMFLIDLYLDGSKRKSNSIIAVYQYQHSIICFRSDLI